MTVVLQQIFRRYVERLEHAGIDQAEAEVELVLCHVLGVNRLKLYLEGGELLTDEIVSRVDAIVERRVSRYPLQYILKEAWFYGRPFYVSPAVMVPTPETELLVESAARFVRRRDYTVPRILDLGTGSGVIAVTLAKELKACEIVALDISPDALAVAQKNAATLGAAERIEFRESDYFSALRPDERFDVIVSNPPYIAEPDYDSLPPEVLADPKLAMTAGPDGLDAVRVIVKEAPRYLAPGGRIMFEVGYGQAQKVAALTEQDTRYRSIVILRDLNDIDRVVMLEGA